MRVVYWTFLVFFFCRLWWVVCISRNMRQWSKYNLSYTDELFAYIQFCPDFIVMRCEHHLRPGRVFMARNWPRGSDLLQQLIELSVLSLNIIAIEGREFHWYWLYRREYYTLRNSKIFTQKKIASYSPLYPLKSVLTNAWSSVNSVATLRIISDM